MQNELQKLLSHLWFCLSFPLQCLRAAFLSCVEEWVAESPWREERVPSLPWAHLAHNQFKSRLQNFSRILAVHPSVTAFLLRHQGHRAPPSEMVKSLLPGTLCPSALAGSSVCTELAALQSPLDFSDSRGGNTGSGSSELGMICCVAIATSSF